MSNIDLNQPAVAAFIQAVQRDLASKALEWVQKIPVAYFKTDASLQAPDRAETESRISFSDFASGLLKHKPLEEKPWQALANAIHYLTNTANLSATDPWQLSHSAPASPSSTVPSHTGTPVATASAYPWLDGAGFATPSAPPPARASSNPPPKRCALPG